MKNGLIVKTILILLLSLTIIYDNMYLLALFNSYTYTSSTDSRIKIALIDTGVNIQKEYLCKGGHRDFTGRGLKDVETHGSVIANIISKSVDPKKHCFINIKWWHSKYIKNENYYYILKAAIDSGASLINMSLSGSFYSEVEETLMRKALKRGIIIVVAAGNEGKNLDANCNIYPACYDIKHKNYYVVGNKSRSSNHGVVVNMLEKHKATFQGKLFKGTSFSAAFVSAIIVGTLL